MTRIRTSLATASFVVLAVLVSALSAIAQTTLNQTTLAAAITDKSQQVIALTAVTNITASSRNLDGDLIVVGSEAMQVNSVDTVAKTVTVRRGYQSTAYTHANGATVYTGPKQRFYQSYPFGSCTATNEAYLPHIVLPGVPSLLGVAQFDCINSEWIKLKDAGYRTSASLIDTSTTTSPSVQTTEQVVNAVTIPATDWALARGVRCVAVGTGAANANAKNLKFYFGATAVATVTGTTDSGKDYLGEIVVWRTGASTQAGYGAITSDIGAPDAFAVTTSLAEAEGSAIVISFKTANTAAAAASATGKGLYCNWLP